MHFLVTGVSHRSAPIERLQRLAVNRRALPDILKQGTLHVGDIAVLSTCNRTELYTYNADLELGERQLLELLEIIDRRFEPGAEPLTPCIYTYSGDNAIRHLFRVAAGLDALVLGEPEIAGQVSHALRAAGEARSISPPLSRLFHHAIRTSRKVRNTSAIGRARVSISSIGVDLLTRSAGGLRDKSVLVVGAGETGLQAARALSRNGVGKVLVTSRRRERASELAAELSGEYVPFDAFPGILHSVDAVVSCTAAETHVIDRGSVEAAMARRGDRGLLFLDLALPPDVEAGVREIGGVTVFGLDDLREIADSNREERRHAAEEAEEIVDREVQRFKELLTVSASEPIIRALGERAESVRRQELERSLKRLSGLDPEDLDAIDAMTRAIVKKILADPIAYLRDADDLEAYSTVARAFDLPEGDEGESTRSW